MVVVKGGNNREDWRCTGHAMATKQKLITSIQLCKLKKVQTINSDLLMLPFFFLMWFGSTNNIFFVAYCTSSNLSTSIQLKVTYFLTLNNELTDDRSRKKILGQISFNQILYIVESVVYLTSFLLEPA